MRSSHFVGRQSLPQHFLFVGCFACLIRRMKSASRSESELSVLIFPLLPRDDGLEDIPVFRDLAVLHTKQVIEGSVLPAQRTFADSKHEAALSEDLVDAVEFERDALLGPRAHRSAQPRHL